MEIGPVDVLVVALPGNPARSFRPGRPPAPLVTGPAIPPLTDASGRVQGRSGSASVHGGVVVVAVRRRPGRLFPRDGDRPSGADTAHARRSDQIPSSLALAAVNSSSPSTPCSLMVASCWISSPTEASAAGAAAWGAGGAASCGGGAGSSASLCCCSSAWDWSAFCRQRFAWRRDTRLDTTVAVPATARGASHHCQQAHVLPLQFCDVAATADSTAHGGT